MGDPTQVRLTSLTSTVPTRFTLGDDGLSLATQNSGASDHAAECGMLKEDKPPTVWIPSVGSVKRRLAAA